MSSRRSWIVASLVLLVLASALLISFFFDVPHRVLRVLEVGALLIGVGGLLFGARQFKDARRALESLEKISRQAADQLSELSHVSAKVSSQSQTLAEVSAQLSTQFVDRFPDNLPELVKFVSSSDANLDIITDYAGYGSFSRYKESSKYVFALQQRPQPAQVRLLVYNDDLAKQAIHDQWRDLAAIQKRPDLLEEFYHTHKQLIQQHCSRHKIRDYKHFQEFRERISHCEFIEMNLEAQRRTREDLQQNSNLEIRLINGPNQRLMIHAWILRDRALFSFNAAKAEELCFSTKDQRLVGILAVIFEDFWNSIACSKT